MKKRPDEKHVINAKKLFEVLYPSSKNHRIKSVPTPSAQTKTLCEPVNELQAMIKSILEKREPLMNTNRKLWYLIELMVNGALRVSEVLDIHPRDITTTGHVIVNAKKGSRDRIVTCHDAKAYLLKCKENSIHPFTDWNRFYVYREFKKLGIYIQLSGKNHMSVTHSIRQLVTRSMQVDGVNDNMRRTLLGHKSFNALKHYSND